jgi:hypothetical protein
MVVSEFEFAFVIAGKSGTYKKKFYGSASTLDGTKDALVLQS